MVFQLQKLPSNITKYLIIGLIIFGLVVVIPNNKLGVKDSIVLSIILTLTIAVIEHASELISSTPAVATPEKFDITPPAVPVVQITPAKQPENPVEIQSVKIEPAKTTKSEKSTEIHELARLYEGSPNEKQKEYTGSRAEDGVHHSDMPYTDYNHLPMPDDFTPTTKEDFGYSYLPPEKWYPTPPFPPVCVSEKRCPVSPTYTTGTPIDVKEWYPSTKITGPAGINTQYIKDTLNSGK